MGCRNTKLALERCWRQTIRRNGIMRVLIWGRILLSSLIWVIWRLGRLHMHVCIRLRRSIWDALVGKLCTTSFFDLLLFIQLVHGTHNFISSRLENIVYSRAEKKLTIIG